MADLNSHHPLWDKVILNKGGKVVLEFIAEKDLIIMNDGTATLVQNPMT